MRMRALDIKLFRDIRRLWAQALAIALVLACGVTVLLMTYGMYGALEESRATYYERNRFADIFADAKRAPRGLMRDILRIDGVRAAEARIAENVILDIPGRIQAVTGKVLSLPDDGEIRLNLPLLRSGRLPDPARTGEVVVNEGFAEANDLRPGDRFSANLNGRKRELVLTGTVLSPEFIYAIGPGSLLPDNRTYGIVWMPERTAAAAFDMDGAFNNVTLKLDPAANEEEVIHRLDELLDPYGGIGAYGRDVHQSNAFIDAEIEQQRISSIILPPIFYGIAAFLVSMVIGRIIALERSEIGLFKAVGYTDIEISTHYLLMACLIALTGTLIGWVAGTWLARVVARIFAEFYEFPYLIYNFSYSVYVLSGVLAVLSAAAGAAHSSLSAARIAPAVAMSPPAPPRYKSSFLDVLLAAIRVSQSAKMVARSIVRWPLRSAMTALGLSLATAVFMASGFFADALDEMMDMVFSQSNRQHAMLYFSPEIRQSDLPLIMNLPGVLKAEGQLSQSVVLRNGHLEKETGIQAGRPDPDLARIIDKTGNAVNAPEEGILLSEQLAAYLNAGQGDVIEVEFRGGRNETHFVQVSGLVTQYIGLGAYMDSGTLNRLLRQAPRISTANLLLDEARMTDLHGVLKETPGLSGLTMLSEVRRSFRATIRQNIQIMTGIYTTIAVLITFGVAYNCTRIQLSERARELASLRILGFTKREVSFILVGETMILALLAQPPGWIFGIGISYALAAGSSSDLYTIPFVIKPSNAALASLLVLTAALISSFVVRRRLDSLNLIEVMKTRE